MTKESPGDILGFDYGDARTGIARVNTLARIPEPLVTITTGEELWDKISELVEEYNPLRLVVGLPRNMKGEETQQSARSRLFAKELASRTGLEVVLQDESLTSVKAEEMMKNSKVFEKHDVDMLAAAAILKDHLGDMT